MRTWVLKPSQQKAARNAIANIRQAEEALKQAQGGLQYLQAHFYDDHEIPEGVKVVLSGDCTALVEVME